MAVLRAVTCVFAAVTAAVTAGGSAVRRATACILVRITGFVSAVAILRTIPAVFPFLANPIATAASPTILRTTASGLSSVAATVTAGSSTVRRASASVLGSVAAAIATPIPAVLPADARIFVTVARRVSAEAVLLATVARLAGFADVVAAASAGAILLAIARILAGLTDTIPALGAHYEKLKALVLGLMRRIDREWNGRRGAGHATHDMPE